MAEEKAFTAVSPLSYSIRFYFAGTEYASLRAAAHLSVIFEAIIRHQKLHPPSTFVN